MLQRLLKIKQMLIDANQTGYAPYSDILLQVNGAIASARIAERKTARLKGLGERGGVWSK